MTADEIDQYINQIAFSSAEEFIKKYKNDAASIIGHFGLGFYSSFMVSKKVEIITKSYREDAVAMKWSCEGTPEYEMKETTKDFIASKGYDVQIGARPLKRAIQKYIEDELADLIIRGEAKEGDEIWLDYDKEKDKIVRKSEIFSIKN
jgi:HSP90 family molecular chaperone